VPRKVTVIDAPEALSLNCSAPLALSGNPTVAGVALAAEEGPEAGTFVFPNFGTRLPGPRVKPVAVPFGSNV
jgi:hypothetical protein